MSIYRACPNCSCDVEKHPDNGCVLNALIGVVRDRGNVSDLALQDLHAQCSVDSLWGRLGPIVDDLEEGWFL